MTILELVAVVGIISILAGISVPRIGDMVTSAKIDEAKALLNTAAADCLLKSRLNVDNKDQVDDTIISDKRVNPIGFKIDQANDAYKCSYFQLVPTNENDDVRFPIGFSVSDGALSKFANPTSDNQASISSCNRWAGVRCKQDETLKRLIAWKKDIAAKKAACETNYTKWLTVENTTPYKSQRWNPNAEAGCPSRPPRDGSETYRTDPTCTPNGCNREVYGLDGKFVGFTKDDYDRALADKYGKLCTEWVAEKEQQQYTNNTTNILPITRTPECGSREFWFFKGEDQGTKEEFMQTACNEWINEKKSQNFTNNPFNQAVSTPVCGNQQYWFFNGQPYANFNEVEEAKCIQTHEEWRTKGENKVYEAIGGYGKCGERKYVCNNTLVSDTVFYTTRNCGKAPRICGCWHGYREPACKEHEESEYMRMKCPVRPNIDPTKYKEGGCAYVGGGRPTLDVNGWDSSEACNQFARCMGYYDDPKCVQ